jgi:TalC/MipB family fructose-6-phosphate aldolase
MALYVDCAIIAEVAELASGYPVAGVTTNPTILLRAIEQGQRLPDSDVLRGLLDACDGPVFMQPVGETAADLIGGALRYAGVDAARVVVKLPMTPVGLAAALELRRQGVRLALTAVASLAQAYTGVLAGAEWIIPYYGRLRRVGVDACERVSGMASLLASQTSSARLLAASLKTPGDVVEVTLAGAHDVTVPPDVVRALVRDPLSEDAVRNFAADRARADELLR